MRTRPSITVLATWIIALCIGCGRNPEPVRPFSMGLSAENNALFMSQDWDDGNAEIARYRVTERRYGSLRTGHAVFIAVKEPFDPLSMSKARRPDQEGAIDSIKFNYVLTVPAGVYTYRQMATAFFTRDLMRPMQLTTSSQEWCGITHKRLAVRGGLAELRTFSYFEGEGEQSFSLPMTETTVLYDALPLLVRTLSLDQRTERAIRLIPRQISNHARRPQVVDATLYVRMEERIEVPAGQFRTIHITLEQPANLIDQFFVTRDAPHTLVRWIRNDGGRYELEWVRRAPYWQMNGPEHEGAFDAPPDEQADDGGPDGDASPGDQDDEAAEWEDDELPQGGVRGGGIDPDVWVEDPWVD